MANDNSLKLAYQMGSEALCAISAISAILQDEIDTLAPGGENRRSLVCWQSRPDMKPSFVYLEWWGNECSVRVYPDADRRDGNYPMDPTVQRIVGYCAMHSIKCEVDERLIEERLMS